MKKAFLSIIALVLMISTLLPLCACTATDVKDIINETKPTITKLDTPSNIRVDKNNILRWDSVENAGSYIILIDEVEYERSVNSCDLTKILTANGEYEVYVKAKSNQTSFTDSSFSSSLSFRYNGIKVTELAAPKNVQIEYDTVTWNSVSGATSYTVSVGNYSFETVECKCPLSDLTDKNGKGIKDYGYINVDVVAKDDAQHKSPAAAAAKDYYYIPASAGSDVEELRKWFIGYGYNLLDDEYLRMNEHHSSYSVFNLGKLVTAGEVSTEAHNDNSEFEAFSYGSVEELLAHLALNIDSSSSVTGKADLFGILKASSSLKTTMSFALTTDMKSYKSAQITSYTFYVQKGIKSVLLKEPDEKLIKYSLNDFFIKDAIGQSAATAGMTYEQRADYILKTYGTHAILGVKTGGSITSNCLTATNKSEVALGIKNSFSVNQSAGIDASYKGFTAGIEESTGISTTSETDINLKNETSYVNMKTTSYGGNVKAKFSGGVSAALDTWEMSGSNDMPIGVYQDNAYDISYLISLYDADFGNYYYDYLDAKATDVFRDLTKQFERTNSLPMEITSVNGKNVLTIDVSAYQKAGLENAYSPNLLENVLTVYPTYCGKYVDEIRVIGGFDDPDKKELLPLTIKLDKSWNRPVSVVFEDCAIESAIKETPLDISDVKLGVEIYLQYKNLDLVKDPDNKLFVHIVRNGKSYDFGLAMENETLYDITKADYSSSEIIFPIATKDGYDFGGWMDSNGIVVTDTNGKMLDYEVTQSGIIELAPKWNKHVVEITLDNQNADSSYKGTAKYYEQNTVGIYSDFACTSQIESIVLPAKTGYDFGGYYKSVSNNATKDAVGESMIINANGKIVDLLNYSEGTRTTLYALWIPHVYTVTVNSNGGTAVDKFYVRYKDDLYADRECETVLSKIASLPTKELAIFGGIKDAGGNVVVNASGIVTDKKSALINITADAELKVFWTDVYTVTLNANEDKLATAVGIKGTTTLYTKDFKTFYSDFSDAGCAGEIKKIDLPKASGYEFAGYYTEGGTKLIDQEGNVIAGALVTKKSLIVYAQWKANIYSRVNSSGVADENGTYILFGSYPQSKVTSSALISTLNSKAGTLPTNGNERKWTSYGYYISSSNSTDYMWYIDISEGSERYRGVYFTSYRPYWTPNSSSSDNTYQDDNGYSTSQVYWFKYEPLTWRILTQSNGQAMLLCESIIDSQAYQNEYEKKNNEYYIKGTNTYANNYAESTIRKWLNEIFYNTAFSEAEKAFIRTTTVDNSASTTGPNIIPAAALGVEDQSNSNPYVCQNTSDKIFLLSEQEVTQGAYGFSIFIATDTARQLKTTDYAQSQGCYTATGSYAGCGWWWLRSPGYDDSDLARDVSYSGYASCSSGVNYAGGGVVPALQISLQ